MTDLTDQPAALWRRLLALLYDLLPLLALWFIAGMIALMLTGGAFDPVNENHQYLIRALLLGFSAAYFVVSWTRGGQTIGMRAWRLRLVADNGRSLPWPRALMRFAIALLSGVALGAGFWWSLVDPQRRTWHDMATGCRMIRTVPA